MEIRYLSDLKLSEIKFIVQEKVHEISDCNH